MAGVFQNGVWSCGFDFFGTGTSQITAGGVFDIVGSAANLTCSPALARFSGGTASKGISFSGANSIGRTFSTNLVTVITGFAFLTTALPSATVDLVSFNDATAGSAQVGLGYSSAGQFQFYKTNTMTGLANPSNPIGSPGGTVIPNTYMFLEVLVTIDSVAGQLILRVNGVTVINFTGNTKQTANTWVNQIQWGTGGSSPAMNHQFDDLYMLDTTGTAPLNTFLGDVRIRTFTPTADSATGGLNQFSTTPSQSAGSHFANVNEIPANDATSFNSSPTPGQRESYRTAGYNGPNIAFVNVWARFEKDDATSRSVAITGRNNGVDVIGATISSPSSWTHFNKAFTTDPNTGTAWTATGYGNSTTSNAEFGLEIIS